MTTLMVVAMLAAIGGLMVGGAVGALAMACVAMAGDR
jgi:hypothetical protein